MLEAKSHLNFKDIPVVGDDEALEFLYREVSEEKCEAKDGIINKKEHRSEWKRRVLIPISNSSCPTTLFTLTFKTVGERETTATEIIQQSQISSVEMRYI